jgi:hypothetical protein
MIQQGQVFKLKTKGPHRPNTRELIGHSPAEGSRASVTKSSSARRSSAFGQQATFAAQIVGNRLQVAPIRRAARTCPPSEIPLNQAA